MKIRTGWSGQECKDKLIVISIVIYVLKQSGIGGWYFLNLKLFYLKHKGLSIGPDFHIKQKNTTKKFATKVANEEKHIINLSDTQKNTKKEFSNPISQKKIPLKWKKKQKK